MRSSQKFINHRVTTFLLSFLLICDLTIHLCLTGKTVPLDRISCLPTDQGCILERQNMRNSQPQRDKITEESFNFDNNDDFKSELDIPLPKKNEIGEDILLEVNDFVPIARVGHLCGSDSDCDYGLECILITFNDSSPTLAASSHERGTSMTDHRKKRQSQHRVCATATDGKCLNPSFECPLDSHIRNFEIGDRCFFFCECLSLTLNDTCQNAQSTDCTNHPPSDYPTPGNCCPECFDAELPNHLNLPVGHRTDGGTSNKNDFLNGNRTCNFSLPDGRDVIYQHGNSWLIPSDKFACIECHCKDGTQLCNGRNKIECPSGQECIKQDSNEPMNTSICCPPCKPCDFEKKLYNHGQIWQTGESHCKTCTCNHAKTICHELACEPRVCDENEIRSDGEGQCCPRCVCKPDLDCPFGRASDKNGAELCRCLDESFESTEPTVYIDPFPDERDRLIRNNYVMILLKCLGGALLVVAIILVIFLLKCFSKPSCDYQRNQEGQQNAGVNEGLLEKSLGNCQTNSQ